MRFTRLLAAATILAITACAQPAQMPSSAMTPEQIRAAASDRNVTVACASFDALLYGKVSSVYLVLDRGVLSQGGALGGDGADDEGGLMQAGDLGVDVGCCGAADLVDAGLEGGGAGEDVTVAIGGGEEAVGAVVAQDAGCPAAEGGAVGEAGDHGVGGGPVVAALGDEVFAGACAGVALGGEGDGVDQDEAGEGVGGEGGGEGGGVAADGVADADGVL